MCISFSRFVLLHLFFVRIFTKNYVYVRILYVFFKFKMRICTFFLFIFITCDPVNTHVARDREDWLMGLFSILVLTNNVLRFPFPLCLTKFLFIIYLCIYPYIFIYIYLYLSVYLQFEYQQAQLEAEIENLSWKIEHAETTDR